MPGSDRMKGEARLWCDEDIAQTHFDAIARRYDYIMGWYEIPANRTTLKGVDAELSGAVAPQVLDLGCGTGLGLLSWAKRTPDGARHFAVDTSTAMIERSTTRLEGHGLDHKVRFLQRRAENLPFADRELDGLFCSFMLDMHDTEKRREILKEAHRILKPGARARWVVMDAKPRGLVSKLLSFGYGVCYGRWNWLWMLFFPNYAPHCRPIDLEPDLAATGFRIVEKRWSFVTFFPVAIFITEPVVP